MPGEVGIKALILFVPVIGDTSKVKKDAENLGKSVQGALGGKTKQNTDSNASAMAKYGQAMQDASKQIDLLTKNEVKGGMAQTQRQNIIKAGLAIQAAGNKLTAEQSALLQQTIKDSNAAAAAGQKNIMSIAQWAIGWTAVYGAMRGVQQVIRGAITDALDLEVQISRAMSASRLERGGGIPDAAQRVQLKQIYTQELLDYIRRSNVGFKEAGEALYFLATAGLTTKEALAGMGPVLDLTIAGFGSLADISRMTATIYNKFGGDMKGYNTEQEKMTHIVDTIAFAYKNEQVELSEMNEAMSKAEQMAGIVNFKFEDLVATIGFLASGALRGSLAGTALSQTILAAAKSAGEGGKLFKNLGISLDPKKPLDFIDLMEQLHQKLGDGKKSIEEITALFEVFGVRGGGRAIAEIITRWGDFKMAIDGVRKSADGTAKSMREVTEENIRADIKKMSNAFKTAFDEIVFGGDAVRDVTNELARFFINTSDSIAFFVRSATTELKLEMAMMADYSKEGHGAWKTFWKSIGTSMGITRMSGMDMLNVQKQISAEAKQWGLNTEGVVIAEEKALELMADFKKKQGTGKEAPKEWVQYIARESSKYAQKQQPATPILKKTPFAGTGIPPRAGKEDKGKGSTADIMAALNKEFAEANALLSAQQSIAKAYGISEGVLIQQRIDNIGIEIGSLEKKRQTYKAGGDEALKLDAQIADRKNELIVLGGTKEAFYITQGKKEEEDRYKALFTNIDRATELTKLRYQIEGRSQKEMAAAEIEAIDKKIAANQIQITAPDTVKDLSAETEKKLKLEGESLRYEREKAIASQKVLDIKEMQVEAERDISFQAQIWKATGLSEVEIAQNLLASEKARTDISGEALTTKIKEAEQELRLANLKEATAAKQAILDKEKEARQQKFNLLLAWEEVLHGGTLDSLKLKLDLMEKAGIALTEENKLAAEYAVALEKINQAQQWSSQITGNINDGTYNLIQGTGTWGDLLKSINDTILKQSIEQLSKMTIGKGIASLAGNMFGVDEAMKAAETAAKIKQAADAATALTQTTAATTSAAALTAAATAEGVAAASLGVSAGLLTAASVSGTAMAAAISVAAAALVSAATYAAAAGVISSAAGAANGAIFKGGFTPMHVFASGGVVSRPTLGLVGEGRYNEAIVPLPNGRAIPVDMKGGGDSNKTVVINLAVSAIDGANTYQFLSKNKGMIASLIQSAMKDNHPLRRTL